MDAKLEALQRLVDEVGGFAIRDRAMVREQEEMRASLLAAQQAGDLLSRERIASYKAAVQRYFTKFHSEAEWHLRDLDRRLEHLAQRQANAVAERSVAARRTELIHTLLMNVEHL